MTSNEAAQFVGNAVEARKNKTVHFAGVPRKGQSFPDEKPGYFVCPPYPTVDGQTFTPAKTVEEAIQYARSLGVDASEYYNCVELYVANAINAELWQTKERLGTFGDVKVIKPLRFYHRGFWNRRVCVSFVPMESVIRFRARTPFLRKKMTREKWFAIVKNGNASTQDWRHVFRHEIGHAIEGFLSRYEITNRARRRAIARYLNDLERSNPRRFITEMENFSLVAHKSRRQLIAECVAHVLNDGQNRMAIDIVSILLSGRPYDQGQNTGQGYKFNFSW